MKAVVLNYFDTYEDRVDLVHEFFKGQGYEVTVVQSDFRHFKKVHREEQKEGFTFVKSRPYYKNLSIARLISHYKFSSNAFEIVEEIKPDLLYVFVPPNSLAKFASKYKKKNKEVKLILDIIDLWPETMPIGNAKKLPPFTFWGEMRNKSLKYANIVITECDLYQSVLSEVLKGIKVETVYLAKKEINVISNSQLSEDEIHLAYLGSINNIIDISKIKEIIYAIKAIKPVTLHIIGNGEKKQELIDESKSAGATIEYYGELYNPQEKQNVFDKCHFGINIMKDTVCVGLTMKSIDYLQGGLPLLNNINYDTERLVEAHSLGININNFKYTEDLAEVITKSNINYYLNMKVNTRESFQRNFSTQAFFKKLSNITMKL